MGRAARLLATGALLVLMAVLVPAAPAAAHARMVASTPAGGETVTVAPPRIHLEFDERIESSFGGVQVFDPAGVRVPEQAPPTISGSTVELPLNPITASGTYTVVFRVISADSHPIEARYSFIFQPPAPNTTTTTAVRQIDPADIQLEDAGPGTEAGLWAARAINYLALTLVIGLLVAAVVLLPGRHGDHPLIGRAARAAGMAALVWAASAIALFAFGLSNAAARPLPGALTGNLIDRFAETRFGLVVALQAAVAVVVAALTLPARRRRLLLRLALAVAATGAAAPALWGHAGTDDVRALAVANDWSHLLAVTTWAGGLVALATLALRRRDVPVAAPLGRFSRVAGWAFAVVAVTGVVNASLHLGGVDQLTGTSWGKLALLKAGLLAAIGALGYLARSRLLPAVRDVDADDGDGAGRAAFGRLVRIELVLMVIAFGVATQMASGVPADAEAASRVQSIATAFGEGQLNVTVDPARTGSNVVHVYVLDRTGRVDASARAATLTLQRGSVELEADLLPSGPGHWSALNQRIPAKGEWIVRVRAVTAGREASASGAVIIR